MKISKFFKISNWGDILHNLFALFVFLNKAFFVSLNPG